MKNLLNIFIGLFFFPLTVLGQAGGLLSVEGMTQRPFGKNRVQFKDYDWRFKTSNNFEIYYYDYGSGIADYSILYAESEFNRIADLLGHNPGAKTRLIIYNSITDLQQSNIGLENENSRTVGGQTNFIKPKIEIPFTGSLYDFKRELSFGITQIFVNQMMYGGTIREILQNGALLTLPDWFLPGIAAYASSGWSEEMDDYMRNHIQLKKLKRPHKLYGKEAMIVGQSIWNYIAVQYGPQNISSILNLTRIIRDEERAISNTLGVPYKDFIKEWRAFYLEQKQKASKDYQQLTYHKKLRKHNPKKKVYNDVELSPDGKYVAYSENKRGRYKIIIRNLQKKNLKRKVVFRGGFQMNTQRLNDRIPMVAWSDDKQLAIAYVKHGKTHFRVHDLKKRRFRKAVYKKQLEFFNQVTGFDISADGSHLLISSDRTGAADVRAGMNDIYIYDIKNPNLRRITSDLYDDTDPTFFKDSDEIFVFSSNRPGDTLNIEPGNYTTITDDYDLFLYDPRVSENVLTRLTNNPGKELQPTYLKEYTFAYLSDENGINNLYTLDILTKKSQRITNVSQNIKRYSVSAATNDFAFRIWEKRKEILGLHKNLDLSQTTSNKIITPRLEFLKPPIKSSPIDSIGNNVPKDTVPEKPYDPEVIDTDNYQFDPEVVKEIQEAQQQTILAKTRPSSERINIKGAFPYDPLFTAVNSVTTPFRDPLRGFGILFEVELSDLLENHRIKAGALGITNLRTSSYFGEYSYLAKRIDFTARYDRKSIFINQPAAGGELRHRYSSNLFSLTAAYPFMNSMRISGSVGYLDSRFVDQDNIFNPPVYTSFLYNRLELLFDNTYPLGVNMLEGTRIRVSYETATNTEFNQQQKNFDKLFVDIRNYQSLSREIVFATRLSFGRFGGRSPKQFMLGGMDNWLTAQTDPGQANNPLQERPEQGNPDILFHEFATNLRGFNYNKAAGRNFLLFNAEMRIPIVKYIFKNSISSNFFKNLQFIGFTDVGAAWNNAGPWQRQNDLNTRTITEGLPSTLITLRNFNNPWLVGYGIGARTLFLGYYIKVDMAWSVEDFIVDTKPKYFISLGYDF